VRGNAPLCAYENMDAASKYALIAGGTANTEDCAAWRDCLVVVIGWSGYDLDLIHAARRLAKAMSAIWTVVDVQTSTFRFIPDSDRDRRLEIARIAESLGAEAVTIHGASMAATVAGYARLRQATKIIVGSPTRLGWQALRHQARIGALRQLAPGIDVIAMAPKSHSAHTRARSSSAPAPTRSEYWLRGARHYVLALTVTGICTAVAFPFADHVDLINIVMIYLLGASFAALLLGRGPSALTAAANTLAFDYFFVPPRFSFLVLDTSYLVTFAAMLLVTLIIANLMIAVRAQTEAAAAREQHTAALYTITRDLAIARNVKSMVTTAVRHIGEVLLADAEVLLCDESGQIIPLQNPSLRDRTPQMDMPVAQWVANHREHAGAGTGRYSEEQALYLPLRGSHATIGVLVVQHADSDVTLRSEQRHLLEAIADQLALALERQRLAEIAHAAHLAAERTTMRNTLLASISHDLRTPLSAIAGAGSMMAQSDFALDMYRRVTLGRLIEDKARDMSDLLANVLELVRLESGADVLHRDWHSMSDLVGMAIQRHEDRLAGWEVITDLPEDLPLLQVDSNLMVQLLSNLLENAIKYTPAGTRIHISAQRYEALVRLVFEDTGPGLNVDAPDRLFDKFTRGRPEGSISGVGLGLTICRAVARLHGGDILATASPLGGARFEITIPYTEEASTIEGPSLIV
jgi:two-component system, OmpR family, sensor histidine kinase KdpD